jgi:Ubiquitin family
MVTEHLGSSVIKFSELIQSFGFVCSPVSLVTPLCEAKVNCAARNFSSNMQIIIKKKFPDEIITLDVESSDTVADIKHKLLCKRPYGWPPDIIGLSFGGKQISGTIYHKAKVGRSVPPIHPLHKLIIRSDLVVVDGSSRSDGEACQVNLFVL